MLFRRNDFGRREERFEVHQYLRFLAGMGLVASRASENAEMPYR
jgi:hypothetical protein